jgi:hypothetical protein
MHLVGFHHKEILFTIISVNIKTAWKETKRFGIELKFHIPLLVQQEPHKTDVGTLHSVYHAPAMWCSV